MFYQELSKSMTIYLNEIQPYRIMTCFNLYMLVFGNITIHQLSHGIINSNQT